MKRILLMLVLILALGGCMPESENESKYDYKYGDTVKSDFIGCWLTKYEIMPEKGASKKEYAEKADKMSKIMSSFGITDIFVQVRPDCDSIYPSSYFEPCKQFCLDGKLCFDFLQVWVKAAHKYGLKIYAWINPYRISAKGELENNNRMLRFLSEGDVYKTEKGGYYLNPASESVNELILSGIREILDNYEVDGIHIDDYFYPSTEKGIDEKQFKAYTDKGGEMSLEQYRRSCVSSLISSIFSLVKSRNTDSIFSVSPCGDIKKNMDTLYADVKLWCGEEGYADMIIPQIYYGFENSSQPFIRCLEDWLKINTCKTVRLAVGLAPYKAGKEDKYAGKGINEWLENDDIIKKEALISSDKTGGFVLFSYSYIFVDNNLINNEIKNLKSVIE